MWSIHTVDYYSATERNEVLIHATTRTTLEIIMLHQSQTQRPQMVHSHEVSSVGKCMEMKSRLDACQVLGSGGHGEQLLNECEVFIWSHEHVLELEVTVVQHSEYTKCH